MLEYSKNISTTLLWFSCFDIYSKSRILPKKSYRLGILYKQRPLSTPRIDEEIDQWPVTSLIKTIFSFAICCCKSLDARFLKRFSIATRPVANLRHGSDRRAVSWSPGRTEIRVNVIARSPASSLGRTVLNGDAAMVTRTESHLIIAFRSLIKRVRRDATSNAPVHSL